MNKPQCFETFDDDFLLVKEPSWFEAMMDDYWLTGAQLRRIRTTMQRRLNVANKLFNSPQLNQVNYKSIVAAQDAFTALLKECDRQLATREPADTGGDFAGFMGRWK